MAPVHNGLSYSHAGTSPRKKIQCGNVLVRIAFTLGFLLPTLSPAEEKDLFAVASGTPQLIALDDVLGKSPKTVYIPGRFYRNGQGALFIDGQRFSTPNGNQDIAGFVSASGTYLIAVRANVTDLMEQSGSTTVPTKPLFTDEELRNLSPEMRLKALQVMGASASNDGINVKFGNGKPNATIFYRCGSPASCVIVRVVKGMPTLHITDNALWFNVPSQNQRIGREFVSTLMSYSSIDTGGKSADGPAGVLYAAPLPKGEWLIKKLEKEYTDSIEYSWVVRSSNGNDRVLFSDTDLARNTLRVVPPTSIVIDGTPISASAAYGTVSVVNGGYNRTFGETSLFTWPACATMATKNRFQGYALNIVSSRDAANFLAEQLAIIPFEGKVQAFGQTKIDSNVIGIVDVDCEKGVSPEKGVTAKPYAYLDTDGFSFARGKPKVNGLGGFVHIQSPKGNLLLLTERLKEGKPLPGIRVEDGKRVEATDVKRFFERYGIANE